MGEQQENGHFFIVGVGVSSDRLPAISRLVASLPYNSLGFSVIIAPSCHTTHEGKLLSWVEKHSPWPVLEIQDDLKIEPEKIYIPPVGYQIRVKDRHLKLEECSQERLDIFSIDTFFESLAKEWKNFAIGILLSGTGNEGYKGAEAIKNHQGYVLAQNPDKIQEKITPSAFSPSGYFDKVLPIEQIGIELEQELSANEEHRHTFTKELETANEELNTANAELAYSKEQLQIKEKELSRIREDMELTRERFYLALENSSIILFHQDDQLRYTWIYNTYSKIPKEKIIGKNDLEINDLAGSEEDVLRLHQSKEEVLHTAHEVQIEIRIGGRWYDLKIKPIIKDEKVSGISGVGIDITDRKTSADIVERNQSILSNIINQGEDSVIAVSKEFRILAINENIKRDMFQRLHISLGLGDNLIEKLRDFPDQQKAVRGFFERTFRGEKVYLDTYLTTDKEGKKEHYYDGVFFPITDLQGEIIGGANIDREVTERILLEQQVQEITKRSANLIGDEFFKDLTDQLATLFHMGYVYVGVFQEDGKAIRTLAFRINGILVENFEYSLANTPCAVVANNNKSYHMEQVRKKFPYDEKLQRWSAESYVGIPIASPHTEKSIGVLVMMDQHPWKDTPYTDYLLTLQSIRAGAELERMSAEQRIKEKSLQLENISNNVPGVIYEIKQTKEGEPYYAYISEACESIFGITQEEFLKNAEGLLSLIHDEDKAAYLNERKRATAELDNFHFEGRVCIRSNEIKWVKLNSKALRKEDGTVSWYGFIDDITQIKEVEAALEEAKNEAEKAARAKEDFLATMSHEIRTPLNAIIGLSNLLLKKNPRPDQLENFKVLKFSSESLMSLVNDILDYSKMEAGKVEIEASHYNIRLLLQSIHQAHLLYAEERRNSLEIKIEDGVPEILKGDQVKLAQVLNNLVSNANKFTQAGIISLEVSLEKEEQEEVHLHFAVRDNGIGISPENIQKIFEKFTQADSSTVRHYGGTGLGLSITKALLEMQDSEIKVESEEGNGSVFYFILKQQKGVKQNMIQTGDNDRKVKALDGRERRIQILLVEDVAINRMVVQQYFEEWWELPADEATNGIEAIKMVQEKSYDIVLMDIRMPKMDGYEASEGIRKLGDKYKDMPIIALTADTTAEFNTDKRARYINDVITKPFSPQALYAMIVRYTSGKDEVQKTHFLHPIEREHDGKQENELLRLDFEKAEDPFREDADKVVRFYEMAIRSLLAYRENYMKALQEQDKKLISDAMHKAKVLIDMLGLNGFYEKMYRTRRKMEAGSPVAIIEEEGAEISKDIDLLLVGIQQRLDVVRQS
ncbi:chemotaxis protein CheB [Catalinimonas niigatensis]|uniref:chemotaxis protein CheB n=1 Tax=Catalinimonas niigatensis TaxID=1397264 RepID=UPI002664FD85|nr:chemotaxis protein CheB [Catalinimonas niigatensis]WPP48391.1 chemotaxis protein CheB [Catalinimonas niigatensis]